MQCFSSKTGEFGPVALDVAFQLGQRLLQPSALRVEIHQSGKRQVGRRIAHHHRGGLGWRFGLRGEGQRGRIQPRQELQHRAARFQRRGELARGDKRGDAPARLHVVLRAHVANAAHELHQHAHLRLSDVVQAGHVGLGPRGDDQSLPGFR
ncbi:MAG: hypothetical protein BWY25_02202 [Chloroflexi bacterium ADurb.Bin222]|nr:MAG: hypothetical protein BWY25_02202 [Chloroflexi bacterium ADurb.Bin222]